MTFEESINVYFNEIKGILLEAAKTKGYHGDEEDGRKMFDIIHHLTGGGGHPDGEIIYKLTRYRRVNDPRDIVKVGAWAFLIWDRHKREAQ